jgi:hypothetical protein
MSGVNQIKEILQHLELLPDNLRSMVMDVEKKLRLKLAEIKQREEAKKGSSSETTTETPNKIELDEEEKAKTDWKQRNKMEIEALDAFIKTHFEKLTKKLDQQGRKEEIDALDGFVTVYDEKIKYEALEMVDAHVESSPNVTEMIHDYVEALIDNPDWRPALVERFVQHFVFFLKKNNATLGVQTLIKLWDANPKIVDTLFEYHTVWHLPPKSQKVRDHELMILLTESHCCGGRDRDGLVLRYLKVLEEFQRDGEKYAIRSNLSLIVAAVHARPKVTQYYADFMNAVGHEIDQLDIENLLGFFRMSTEDLTPFMKLASHISESFTSLYIHATDHEAFLKPFIYGFQYGVFSLDRSDVMSALHAVFQVNLEDCGYSYAKGLLTLLKKFPEPVEDLMDDSSIICYLLSKHEISKKELTEYRRRYGAVNPK